MAARQPAPVIGAQDTTQASTEDHVYPKPGTWILNVGYRYQHSDRHFRGTHEEADRQAEHSEVINDVHLFDIAATYTWTRRFNVTLSVPVLDMNRSQPIRDANRNVVDRFSTQSGGLGDLTLVGRMWILNPEKSFHQNISVGLGIKVPTGEHDVRDTFETLTGSEVRTVDQSIQPGDGGWGIVFDMSAFKVLANRFTVFTSGAYLSNPKGTNGVPTFRGRASESIMSVADQYIARGGVAFPLVRKYGLAASAAMRMEGVPVRDLFGPSHGFRRPGYAVSFEPGIIFSHRFNTFSVYVPIAVQRNRQRSVPDEIDNNHGDAAFADYVLLVGYSRRF